MSSGGSSIFYTDSTISNPAVSSARIHPIVIFKIADHYVRRGRIIIDVQTKTEEDPGYCIGLLLGEILNGEAIIRDIVPIKCGQENEEKFYSEAYAQHHCIFQNEKILGWYTFSNNYKEFPAIISRNGIHLWMRPYETPKIDVFAIKKDEDGKLNGVPIQYKFEANISEQLALSRVADASSDAQGSASSNGSLQAACNELIDLLKYIKERLNTGNRETVRRVHAALEQVFLQQEEAHTVEDSLRNITNFSDVLKGTTEDITKVEEFLAKEY